MTEETTIKKVMIIGGHNKEMADAIKKAVKERYGEGIEIITGDIGDEDFIDVIVKDQELETILPFSIDPVRFDISEMTTKLPLPTKPPPFRMRDHKKKR